jgi:hypothetical protein
VKYQENLSRDLLLIETPARLLQVCRNSMSFHLARSSNHTMHPISGRPTTVRLKIAKVVDMVADTSERVKVSPYEKRAEYQSF